MLRKGIEAAIKETAKSTFNARKIKVAEKVVSLELDIEEPELIEKLEELISKIKLANNIE